MLGDVGSIFRQGDMFGTGHHTIWNVSKKRRSGMNSRVWKYIRRGKEKEREKKTKVVSLTCSHPPAKIVRLSDSLVRALSRDRDSQKQKNRATLNKRQTVKQSCLCLIQSPDCRVSGLHRWM